MFNSKVVVLKICIIPFSDTKFCISRTQYWMVDNKVMLNDIAIESLCTHSINFTVILLFSCLRWIFHSLLLYEIINLNIGAYAQYTYCRGIST